jgi:oligopeptide/dipeptide ABC transporter ATP-binding protein
MSNDVDAAGATTVTGPSEQPVIEVRNLEVTYGQSRGRPLRAVNDVSFAVRAGRTLGIVGESGSGKTTVVRALLRIIDSPGKIASGEVLFHGQDLLGLPEKEMAKLRGSRISMIFQDPSGSLDPLKTIGQQFIETIRRHRRCSRGAARQRSLEVLKLVGVPNPDAAMRSYPLEFSAGMTQRMMIGMAISCEPDVLLADEPTTGLGVVLQASILAELKKIQQRLGTTLILITHDMGIVAHEADDILVMYGGKCVEYGPKEQVLTRPVHPYTLGLIRSVPEMDQERGERLKVIPGFPPDLSSLPPGCPFVERCYRSVDECPTVNPQLIEREPNHLVACHSPVPEEERREEANVSVSS